MAGTVKLINLGSPTARDKLKPRRQPYWQFLIEGAHLGWQRDARSKPGRWMLRRYLGRDKYTVKALGVANDGGIAADGEHVLNHTQAQAMALATVAVPDGKGEGPFTVRVAWERYLEHKRDRGQPVRDAISRGSVHILPFIGDMVVEKLTVEDLHKWFTAVSKTPAQLRPIDGKPQYKAKPTTEKGKDEATRKRQVTSNRVLTYLKAALNHAYDEGKVKSRAAWDRKLKPFKGVNTARVRYLEIEEAQRLLNATDPEFRPLLRAALETGARYGDLTRLTVSDFSAASQTVHIRLSKTGNKSVHVNLTDAGVAFFRQHCAGRRGDELMFRHADGSPWKRSNQALPIRTAVKRANIHPPITFHGLRHTWASLAVQRGVPLLLVAQNLGHTSTRMVEAHYGHFGSSYAKEVIRKGAPDYGIANDSTVVPLQR